MRFIVFSIIVLSLFRLNGQNFSSIEPDRFQKAKEDTTYKVNHMLSFSGNMFINSSNISNSLINSVFVEEYIGREVIDDSFKKLSYDRRNRFGITSEFNLVYKTHSEKLKSNLVFGLRDVENRVFHYSGDLFTFMFEGNEDYIGKTADLGNTIYRHLNYQSFDVGIEKMCKNLGVFWGAGVSIYKGGYSQQFLLDATLYTDQTYLEAEGSASLVNTQRNKNRITRNNGIGAGMYAYATKNWDKHTVSVEIKDIGFLVNPKVNAFFEIDTLVRFTGIDIDNLINGEGEQSMDILDIPIDTLSGTRYTQYMPFRVHLTYQYQASDKLALVAGFWYIHHVFTLPQVYLKTPYKLTNSLQLNPVLAIGGLGRVDVGIGTAIQITKKTFLNADLFYFESLLAPSSTTGQGFSFSLAQLF